MPRKFNPKVKNIGHLMAHQRHETAERLKIAQIRFAQRFGNNRQRLRDAEAEVEAQRVRYAAVLADYASRRRALGRRERDFEEKSRRALDGERATEKRRLLEVDQVAAGLKKREEDVKKKEEAVLKREGDVKKEEQRQRKERADILGDRKAKLKLYEEEDELIKDKWRDVDDASDEVRRLQAELERQLRDTRKVVVEDDEGED